MKSKLPKRKPTRLKDYDYASANTVFFLTARSQSNHQVFKNHDFNFKCIDYIKEEKTRLGHSVYVYCLIPNHLHILMSPLESNIPVTQYVNGLVSKITRLSWNYGYSRKLMQRSFYDHIVREEDDLKQIAEYILHNPVRKGLVQKWEDYTYCGLIDPLPI